MRIGSGTPLSVTRPPSSASTSLRFIDSQMDSAKTTSPGPARPRTREAMLTGSPKTSPLSRRTSPTLAPTRTSMRSHSGTLWFQSQILSWTAAPQSTAWVGDSKATRSVPPIVFTRPVPEPDRPLQWAEHPPIGDDPQHEDHRHHREDAGHVVQLAARLEKLPEAAFHVEQFRREQRSPGEGPPEFRPG